MISMIILSWMSHLISDALSNLQRTGPCNVVVVGYQKSKQSVLTFSDD